MPWSVSGVAALFQPDWMERNDISFAEAVKATRRRTNNLRTDSRNAGKVRPDSCAKAENDTKPETTALFYRQGGCYGREDGAGCRVAGARLARVVADARSASRDVSAIALRADRREVGAE